MKCRGTRKDDQPCESEFVDETGYCPAHREDSTEMRERQRKGGAATSAKIRFVLDELPWPISNHADAEKWLSSIARGVLAGTVDRRDANAATKALSEWVKTHAGKLQAVDLEELRKAVRQITRFISENRSALGALQTFPALPPAE